MTRAGSRCWARGPCCGVSVAVGIALDGLPGGCVIDDELWSDVSDDPDWPSFPQLDFRDPDQMLGPLANGQNKVTNGGGGVAIPC